MRLACKLRRGRVNANQMHHCIALQLWPFRPVKSACGFDRHEATDGGATAFKLRENQTGECVYAVPCGCTHRSHHRS